MTCNCRRTIEDALKATGLPYAFEPGKKHLKIKLDGHMVGILPLKGLAGSNEGARRATLNTVSQIRRVSQGMIGSGRGVRA